MSIKKGYVYLLKASDGNQILSKYGYSSIYPQERLYYWNRKLKESFMLDFVAYCKYPVELENEIKWLVFDSTNYFMIENHFELALNYHEQIKSFIRENKFFIKEIKHEN